MVEREAKPAINRAINKNLTNGGDGIMENKNMKGIALILFGILLCIGGVEINRTILHNFSDFPFSMFGVMAGIAGLVIVFMKNIDK